MSASFSPASTGPAPLAVLPPLPPRGGRADVMAPAQRNAMVAGIVALHVAAVWGLLQIREVREAVAEAAPMFVSLIAPPELPKPEVIAPPPPVPVPQVQKRSLPQVIAAAPSPTPSTFMVPEKPPEIVEPPPPVLAAVVVAAPPAPPPPVAPKIIPASAVQYLEPIAPEYPRLAQKANETGTAMVAVYVDGAGLPKTVQLSRSSGHPRLDEAALAAIRKARFKPWIENGQATAGWAFVPVKFELEK